MLELLVVGAAAMLIERWAQKGEGEDVGEIPSEDGWDLAEGDR